MIISLILSSAYLGSIIMISAPLYRLACLNPAIGISTALTMSFFGDTQGIKTIYIFIAFPFIGAICGLIFHELVYKNIKKSLKEGKAEN